MGERFLRIFRSTGAADASATLRAAAVTAEQCVPQAMLAANNSMTSSALRSAVTGVTNGLSRTVAAGAPLPVFLRYSECVATAVLHPLPMPQGRLPEVVPLQQSDGIERVAVGNGSIPAGEWLTVPLDLAAMGVGRVARGIRGLF
ncbi:MAG: hypothetical protein K2Q12_07150 [Rickettsiales bacterium]|nr:hypothetical protein [Rickettsiales bacterium]